jgi:hypothetical protein
MREKTTHWFEVSVTYKKTDADGTLKKATDTIVVDAPSFAEAEKRAIKELAATVPSPIDIKNITPTQYKTILFDDHSDKWYKAKLTFLCYDDDSARQKRTTTYLVQADTLAAALHNVEDAMDGTGDYVTATLSQTKVLSVYER